MSVKYENIFLINIVLFLLFKIAYLIGSKIVDNTHKLNSTCLI